MSAITETMSADHKRCDELFAAAETAVSESDWDLANQALNDFIAGMNHHFKMEEEVMFPAFESATGMTMGPTQMMRSEHEQMRELFTDLEAGAAEKDVDEVLGLCETLLMIMQQHNVKEEQMLYRMADEVLPGAEVVSEMQAL
ncbi:MAG: hemerythrin domain-containing protein [Gammaproteobacteria bacterium]|nr:MAG: hemerythrin domain-containing protein [Gammaproteobacteria bacterium]RLA24010.1 MAG: hemerythrin domain-containing protein [Gammaproteobacteria bacterium]